MTSGEQWYAPKCVTPGYSAENIERNARNIEKNVKNKNQNRQELEILPETYIPV